jgi:hypothetical protein
MGNKKPAISLTGFLPYETLLDYQLVGGTGIEPVTSTV